MKMLPVVFDFLWNVFSLMKAVVHKVQSERRYSTFSTLSSESRCNCMNLVPHFPHWYNSTSIATRRKHDTIWNLPPCVVKWQKMDFKWPQTIDFQGTNSAWLSLWLERWPKLNTSCWATKILRITYRKIPYVTQADFFSKADPSINTLFSYVSFILFVPILPEVHLLPNCMMGESWTKNLIAGVLFWLFLMPIILKFQEWLKNVDCVMTATDFESQVPWGLPPTNCIHIQIRSNTGYRLIGSSI